MKWLLTVYQQTFAGQSILHQEVVHGDVDIAFSRKRQLQEKYKCLEVRMELIRGAIMNIGKYRVDDSDKEVVAIAEVIGEEFLNNDLKDAGICTNGTKVMLVDDGRGGYRMYGFQCTWSDRTADKVLGPAYKLIRWIQ